MSANEIVDGGMIERIDFDKETATKAIHIAPGTIEAMKWIAAIVMTLDHINAYLFNNTVPALFAVGRLAMPLFMFILVYGLMQPGARVSGVHLHVMKRLAIAGLVATPFMLLLRHGQWWPINIMFTLLALTWILRLAGQGGVGPILAAALVVVGAGAVVEFWWWALLYGICAAMYCKTGNKWALLCGAIVLAALFVVNQNVWALAVFPIILVAPKIKLNMPRIRHFFYIYFPAHLAIIYAASLIVVT
jgi:hypothetical protein